MAFDQIFRQIETRIDRTWNPPSWWNLLVCLPWVAGIVFLLYGLRADQVTATREQTAYGQIVSHEPSNHDRYGYLFSVDGKQYAGWAIPGKQDYEISQQVLVFYDPFDPNKSALADFAESGDRVIGPLFLCVFGVIGLALLILFRRRVTRTRPRQPELPIDYSDRR